MPTVDNLFARKWADSTCRAYDSVFYHYIAEIYNDIEYASLTEETAEQIWSSKIDIFEGSDAQDQRARSIFVSFVEQACRAGLSTRPLSSIKVAWNP